MIADYSSRKSLQALGYSFDGEKLSQLDAEVYLIIEAGIKDGLADKAKRGK